MDHRKAEQLLQTIEASSLEELKGELCCTPTVRQGRCRTACCLS